MGITGKITGRGWKAGSASRDYSLKRVLKSALALKALLLGLIYLGYWLFPFNLPNYQANFIYPPGELPNLWTPLKTWDGQIYLYLADHGYGPHQFTNAFYPLFPFLVRVAGSILVGNDLLGGLLISHFFMFLTVVYLYRLTRDDFDERTAFYGCLFLLAFPMGFYLGLLYTESLFLLLTTAYFYYWKRKKYWPAAFCAFLLPLTRPTGILVLLPALVAWREKRQEDLDSRSRWPPLAGFLAGLGAYFLAMKLMTGNAISAFEAEKYYIALFDIKNLFHPMKWIASNFFKIDSSNSIESILLFNRIFFLFFLWILVISSRHLSKSYFVFSLVLGIVPALSGGLVTYMRYLLVLFPVFPVLALKWRNKEGFYLGGFFVLQAYFAVRQALNYFVS
jgi:Gpi18-like mannosyltransferase